MKNKNYYPFERNHYFYSKLLTVRDFELEQRYFNNKRRIQNRFIHGSGVVAGLDVVLVDYNNISVEMGMALDYHGREIVVQEPVIKELRLLDGFDQVKDSANVYLCIEYDEQLTEPVHSVASPSTEITDDNQFNRISESYRLFLTDEPLPPEALSLFKIYKDRKVLFQNDKLLIEQIVPKFVSQEESLDIIVEITKRGSAEPLDIKYEISSNHLTDKQGKRNIAVHFQEKVNKPELKVRKNYLMQAHEVKNTTDILRVAKEKFTVKLGEEEYKLEQSFDFQVQVIEEPVHEKILADYYKEDFSEMVSASHGGRIYLAKLNLVTTDKLYIIDSLEKMPYQQYVVNNELLQVMLHAGGSDEAAGREIEYSDNIQEEIRSVMADYFMNRDDHYKSWSTGVEEIDLGFEDSKNKRFFTNEIAHGLGTGNVALFLAVEDIDNDQGYAQNVLIYGDRSVFEDTLHEPGLPLYHLGALSYPDKGTFRMGIHLLRNVEAASIKIRWWAYSHPGEEEKDAGLLEMSKVTVTITPDTVNLAPREKAYFTAQVEGTNKKECRWYVKEDKGGKIDHNGVYEAPNSEGVFEIVAESVELPEKKASAYVVVKG